MRKLFAITMLVAYLFNLAGYRAFFQYSIRQSEEHVIGQIDDSHYDDNQLIEVKIKLNLPYMSDRSGYERFDGDVELQGVHYNYVKRKISGDTLYILCLPNQAKTDLIKAGNKYGLNATGYPSGKENNNRSAKNSSVDEIRQQLILFDFTMTAPPVLCRLSTFNISLSRTFLAVPGKPPDMTA